MKNLLRKPLFFGSLFLLPFTGWSQYVVNGDAIDLGGNCYQLTPAATFKGGAVWFQNKITLNEDFNVQGTLNLGSIDAGGADGIAFVLQPICSGLGGVGGGIGYLGITPSLAIEFDTWQNGDVGDPAQDHIALMKNGSTNHNSANNLAGPVTSQGNLENGANHTIDIGWNAATTTLTLYFNGNLLISYSSDIVSGIFGGNANVFWGFTAATGAAINFQTVCISNVSFTEEGSYTVTSPSCPDFNNGAIDFNPAGGIAPFSYAWSNGADTEDITDLVAGTYTVTVTDGNGCQSYFTIELTDELDEEEPVAVCQDISVTLSGGIATIAPEDVDGGSSDNCGIVSMSLSQSSFTCDDAGIVEVTLTVADAAGNMASCTANVNVVGEVPVCEIEAVPGAGPYTGGPETTIYLGYGPQTVTLSSSATGGSAFTYSWSPSNGLDCSDCAAPVFTPDTEGNYEFTLTVTNEFGCSSTCTITICVLDIRVPGTNGKKVYICHVPPGNPDNPQTLSISVNAVPAHIPGHDGDHLGRCDQSCDDLKGSIIAGDLIPSPDGVFSAMIYPNPSTSDFRVSVETESAAPVSIKIFDLAGKVQYEIKEFAPDQEISTGQELGGGIYIMRIQQGNEIQNIRIIKQR